MAAHNKNPTAVSVRWDLLPVVAPLSIASGAGTDRPTARGVRV